MRIPPLIRAPRVHMTGTGGGGRPCTHGLTWPSELAREKMWARIYLIPALQAEEDRDQVRRYLADRAREKELLGTETKVYNSDRHGTMPLIFPCHWLTRRQICTADIRCDTRERAKVEESDGPWSTVETELYIYNLLRDASTGARQCKLPTLSLPRNRVLHIHPHCMPHMHRCHVRMNAFWSRDLHSRLPFTLPRLTTR